MKELRSFSGHFRTLFAFDPDRRAMVLLGGDKLKPTTTRSLNDLRSKRPLSSDARKRVDEIKRAMQLEIALAELRELRGATQTEVADSLGTSRPNVGRIESEIDLRLSTLDRYVEALGGRLEIHVVFEDAGSKLTAQESPRAGFAPVTALNSPPQGAPQSRVGGS